MNYGKKKASRKQKEITSKSRMQKKRIGYRLFKAFLFQFTCQLPEHTALCIFDICSPTSDHSF